MAIIVRAHADAAVIGVIFEDTTTAASKLGFAWQPFRPTSTNDYDEIFTRLVAEHFEAAYVIGDAHSNPNGKRIVELSLRYLIPVVSETYGLARAGLLFSYGQDFLRSLVRASEYIDKILRGAKPREIAIEQAADVQLVRRVGRWSFTTSPSQNRA